MKRLIVVGGMNLDLLGVPAGPLLPRDSNPGKITLRPGGVGRNIAEKLAKAGEETALITALGRGARADLLSALCREAGIDLSLSLQTDLEAPCYLCIHDENGDMALAVNDMSAMERLTPFEMAKRMDAVNASRGCVLDANLRQDSLAFIAQNAAVPLVLDPVSCAKAPRVIPILPRLFAIKPNRMEAEALTGERNVEKAAEELLRRGVQNVFISLGPEGIYFASGESRGYMPALPLPALPATGAGDAVCAGITLALLRGEGVEASAKAGRDAAYKTLMSQIEGSGACNA